MLSARTTVAAGNENAQCATEESDPGSRFLRDGCGREQPAAKIGLAGPFLFYGALCDGKSCCAKAAFGVMIPLLDDKGDSHAEPDGNVSWIGDCSGTFFDRPRTNDDRRCEDHM